MDVTIQVTEVISNASERNLHTQLGYSLAPHFATVQYNTTEQDAQQRKRKKPKGQSAGHHAYT
jgi:hypothetical protein